MANKLVRSESNKMIAGVCSGLGVYLGIDPTIVRIAFVVLTLASGIGFALYIVLAIVMPGTASAESYSGKTVERNIEDLGENIVKSVNQLEESRGGPLLVAGLMIAAGIFFLLGNLGISINLGFIVAIGLIGVGAWLVFRGRSG